MMTTSPNSRAVGRSALQHFVSDNALILVLCGSLVIASTIAQNLKEMKWELTAYTLGREKFMEWEHGILAGLARDFQNP